MLMHITFYSSSQPAFHHVASANVIQTAIVHCKMYASEKRGRALPLPSSLNHISDKIKFTTTTNVHYQCQEVLPATCPRILERSEPTVAIG